MSESFDPNVTRLFRAFELREPTESAAPAAPVRRAEHPVLDPGWLSARPHPLPVPRAVLLTVQWVGTYCPPDAPTEHCLQAALDATAPREDEFGQPQAPVAPPRIRYRRFGRRPLASLGSLLESALNSPACGLLTAPLVCMSLAEQHLGAPLGTAPGEDTPSHDPAAQQWLDYWSPFSALTAPSPRGQRALITREQLAAAQSQASLLDRAAFTRHVAALVAVARRSTAVDADAPQPASLIDQPLPPMPEVQVHTEATGQARHAGFAALALAMQRVAQQQDAVVTLVGTSLGGTAASEQGMALGLAAPNLKLSAPQQALAAIYTPVRVKLVEQDAQGQTIERTRAEALREALSLALQWAGLPLPDAPAGSEPAGVDTAGEATATRTTSEAAPAETRSAKAPPAIGCIFHDAGSGDPEGNDEPGGSAAHAALAQAATELHLLTGDTFFARCRNLDDSVPLPGAAALPLNLALAARWAREHAPQCALVVGCRAPDAVFALVVAAWSSPEGSVAEPAVGDYAPWEHRPVSMAAFESAAESAAEPGV
ncbi:hypothetical protein IP84_02875 [beta proteobacterium AAP99]|nr:hypothetical protein IP84_02875 [beta proteobacterium AAP99]